MGMDVDQLDMFAPARPTTVVSLLDAREGKRRRDEAIDRVVSPIQWQRDATAAVVWCAQTSPAGFTTDDVIVRMQSQGVGMPREPRALGAVMVAAHRAGLIRPTDRYIPTARPSRHRAPVRVWEAS